MKIKETKRCPRCNKKLPKDLPVCTSCSLVFSRLDHVTNRAAREAISKQQLNKVILHSKLPPDINKWKLFWMTLFLGMWGVHFAKIGRKKLFLYQLISFSLLIIFSTLLSTQVLSVDLLYHKYWGFLCWAMILPASIALIIWFFSLTQILFNSFKVPVAIDEEFVVKELDKTVADDIISQVKRARIKNVKSNFSVKRIKVVCKSCGANVKVNENETICPKCDENLEG